MTYLPPETVLDLFRRAGWYPERQVGAFLHDEHPGYVALSQFEGLHVGSTGTGEVCAKSDIQFVLLPKDPQVESWERFLDSALVGVGEVHHAHGELWVSQDGRFFGRSAVHDAFYFEGDGFDEAMERLLLGRRSQPMLHPKQKSVTLYGVEYRRGHPDLYDPSSDRKQRRRKNERRKS